MSTTITCPNCKSQIEITEVMSAQLGAQIRAELEEELRPTKQALEKQAAALKHQQAALEESRQALDQEVRRQVAAERDNLIEQARAKAADELQVELKDRDQQLKETHTRLREAQERELGWRKKERQLKEQAQELELTVTRRLDEERDKIRQEAMNKAAQDDNGGQSPISSR